MLQFQGQLWQISYYKAQFYSIAMYHLHSTGFRHKYLVRSPIQPRFVIDDRWYALAASAHHQLRATNNEIR